MEEQFSEDVGRQGIGIAWLQICSLTDRDGEVDPNLAQRIAMQCVQLAPELTGGKGVEALDIVRHNVGFRPSRRGGPRLEVESIPGTGLVVHNYGIPDNPFSLIRFVGAGGAGYQGSWGMAIKAVEMLTDALDASKAKANL